MTKDENKVTKFTAKINADDIAFAYKLALQSVENDLNALLEKGIAITSPNDIDFFSDEVELRAQRIIDRFGLKPEIGISETETPKEKPTRSIHII